jgi:PhzF family phenazine biosynthesis protein
MKIPYYQIDAFTNSVFSGNPAGVCLLAEWLNNSVLQSIAAENNLSETAFLVKNEKGYELRWFTPEIEVDLCGHATLASAFVILNCLDNSSDAVRFDSKSGTLKVTRQDDLLAMDFPSRKAKLCPTPKELASGLGIEPKEVFRSRDYLAVFDSEDQIKSLQPDMYELSKLDSLGIIVSAAGSESDFVSRFFAPKVGIPEDPVTGSAHSTLIPYWAERLGKSELCAFQLSKRGGELFCKHRGDRVIIAGRAVIYLKGTITI